MRQLAAYSTLLHAHLKRPVPPHGHTFIDHRSQITDEYDQYLEQLIKTETFMISLTRINLQFLAKNK